MSRYFVVKNGQAVVDKQVFSGDTTATDEVIAKFTSTHPSLTVTEMDQPSFDATACTQQQTPLQKDWATFKASGPSPLQAVSYLAKYLGLE